jgi:hypothetical protein
MTILRSLLSKKPPNFFEGFLEHRADSNILFAPRMKFFPKIKKKQISLKVIEASCGSTAVGALQSPA